MIAGDQPTIFGPSLRAALSSVDDGNMRFGDGDDTIVKQNRQVFLHKAGIDITQTSLVRVTYDVDNFARYRIARETDKSKGMALFEETEPADALVTDQPGHALFLLLADCVGAIIYDPVHRVLMVSHLGRHATEIEGAKKSIEYLKKQFNADAPRLKVWLSPGVGSASYPLKKFHGQSLRAVITDQLVAAGVVPANIEHAAIDTATSEDYYSHSEYLKGNQPGPARFALVALMTAQGEPAS